MLQICCWTFWVPIHLLNIGHKAFVDADVSSTLALVWNIIQFYQFADASAFGSGVTGELKFKPANGRQSHGS